ncbi:MAG: efflux RND transporter permease subunit [Bacteroidota bacterium]
MSITELSIRRPSLILVIFLVIGLAGYYGYTKLGYEMIPKFDMPFIIVNTTYPGASPSDVENSVTRVIEEAVSNVENVLSIRSNSMESVSFIFVELRDGTNIDLALQDAQRNIDARLRLLPEGADPPSLTKFASDEFPIVNLGVTSTLSPTDFFDLVDDQIKPTLSSVEGVGDIRVVGGQEREIKVNVNRQQLEARGLTILQVVQAVNSANLDFPTGKIENEEEQVIIRLAGKFNSTKDIEMLTVASDPLTGTAIKLNEIAEVIDGQKRKKTISRTDGKSGIGIQVLKSSDANAVAVADGVLNKLEGLKSQYEEISLQFEVANNQTDFTKEAVNAVSHDLMLAIILVAIVMLFFLHSFRNALIVMLAIPTSLVATLLMMYAFNFTLNMMTLLAMSLVVGILVDDSIVVLENIYRHLEKGENRKKAALIGRNEIAFTALSITLVDVVVFVPVALAGGTVGKIMGQFALVVTFSTLMSLFVSFTLTPMLASRFSRLEEYNDKTLVGMIFNGFEKMLTRLNNWYARVIERILTPLKIPYGKATGPANQLVDGNAHPPRRRYFNFYLNGLLVIASTVVIFLSSFLLVSNGYIGSSFVTQGDRGQFILNVELPKDATLKETNLAMLKAEEYIRSQEGVTGVFATVGLSTGMLGNQESEYLGELAVNLVPKDERPFVTDRYAQIVRDELEKKLPGVKITSSPVSFFGGADNDPIVVFISGNNKEKVMDYANAALAEVKKIPGTLEAQLSVEEGTPEIRVTTDRERMANLGISMEQVGMTMQTAFNGNDQAKFRTKKKEYDINIQMDDFNRNAASDIEDLTILNNKGQLIKMNQFADIEQSTGPNRLERKNRLPSITLQSKVLGRPSGDVGTDVKALFEEKMPPGDGIIITYDGDIKQQDEGFGSLGLAFAASIILIYLILVALYDSWIYPVVIFFSLPVALVGALLALALTMNILDIFSILGVIMLMGLVAKNAILLVDFANQAREEGMSTHEALVEAGRTRLRPILMTTLSMAIGFLPIALAQGAAAEWKNGLAWVLIGGLLSSMILTLVVVPVIYLFVDKIKSVSMKLFGVGNEPAMQETV